jgi:hypothetical protein
MPFDGGHVMSKGAQKQSVSPFQLILAWSKDWPTWQQDALRRITLNGQLSETDMDDLEKLCRAQHGLRPEVGNVPQPSGLSQNHLPAGLDASFSVSLVSLGTLKNVNRLPDDQTIEFGPSPGLTVIYGANGSGKSGYVRVIKKACRARGVLPDIKPNAFDSKTAGPATAEIVSTIGTVRNPISWRDGIASDPRLSNIFVFDGISARFHVSDDGPATFTPRGLDILPQLARACGELKKRLKMEADSLQLAVAQAHTNWKYRPATAIGKFLATLSESTASSDIQRHATFPQADQQRLTELSDALKSDPKRKAQTTTATATRVRTFANQIEGRVDALNEPAVTTIESTLREAAAAEVAAQAVAGPSFDDTFLPGTGGDTWRQLWDVARTFSVSDAYPSKDFPVTETGARCMLCQQSLGDEAIVRFRRFDEFVRDETHARAVAAKGKIVTLKASADSLQPLATELFKITADLAAEPLEFRNEVASFVKEADARLMHVQKCLGVGAWSEPPVLPASPAPKLIAIAESLDTRAQMELSADNPEERKKLNAAKEELEDKEWFSRNKQDIEKQVARYKTLAILKKCQEDTGTNVITLKSGELNDAIVTKALCAQFDAECESLGLKTLSVKLQSVGGTKGERKFGVRLGATKSYKVEEIACDGEHRCVALAAFLAELSQASHKSALVFDDPVSSLDDVRKAAIAERLVVESKLRQVIVFTHDLAFVCDLQAYAHEHAVEIHGRHLDWSATGPGRCHGDFPWEHQKHKAQMKRLRELCGKADKASREQGQDEYRAFALEVCTMIRSAAERAIEEELFNHVLRRHESRIQVGRLESVGAVEPADYKAIQTVWKTCSDVIPAHSSSRARPSNPPDPAALQELVETLERVVEGVKKRRQGGEAPINYAAPDAPSSPHTDTKPKIRRQHPNANSE